MNVIVQKWEESERGWGIRPDGYSLHLTHADLAAFLKEHWSSMPDSAPDEYSRPSGQPYAWDAPEDVSRDLDGSTGKRFYNNKYPGSGGTDGWKNVQK